MMIIDETREKLQKECKNLDLFKSLLVRSDRQTKEMCRILSQFDYRLAKLEETIAPVYEETGNLQKRQENIMKSIEKLDYVIKYYNVAKEVQSTIHAGPTAETLTDYLSTLDELNNTVCYFEQNNSQSPELINVRRLYEEGAEWVLKEFRQLFSRYSKPHPPHKVYELVHDEEDTSTPNIQQTTAEQVFPDQVRTQLKSMAEWLCVNKREDFITLYAGIKSDILEKSVRSLREHEKSLATGAAFAFSHHHSPSLLRKNLAARDPSSASKRTSKGIQQALKKKFQDVLMADIVTGKAHSGRQTTAEIKEEPPITEKEIVSYLTGVTALYKLMQVELKLMQGIIPSQHQKSIFSRLIASSIRQIVEEGESLANRVKRSTQKHDFSSSLNLFPILRHQASMRHNFDLLFEGCAGDVHNKFQGLVVILQTTINNTLEEFIGFIKNDVDTKVPLDGTVHELTSNIMIFLVQLLNYLDILSRVMTVTEMSSIEGHPDKNRMAFAQYISRVLHTLMVTLNNKSHSYSDPYLKAIFMLNNYHYILKTLRKSTLIDILQMFRPELEFFCENQILENKRIYSQSWSRVLEYIQESDRSLLPGQMTPEMNQLLNMKLKDKDRRIIKDKFAGFNKEIEEIRKIQKGYAIPDSELCAILKRDNQDFIVPRYKLFFEKYSALNFAKNLDKYIKYTPEDVEDIINTFFDSTA